ncbi:MAG: hypothetical protein IJ538_01955 [Clostridia bacterium]|nr:hypothetical protein [Clostridia bacterium]
MKDIVKAFDKMPWILKLVLALPILDIVWAIYRIVKGAQTKNTGMIVVGALWIVFGCVITWLVDFICIIAFKRPTVMA